MRKNLWLTATLSDFLRWVRELFGKKLQLFNVYNVTWDSSHQFNSGARLSNTATPFGSFSEHLSLSELTIQVAPNTGESNDLQTLEGREAFEKYMQKRFENEKAIHPEFRIPEIVFELPIVGSGTWNPIVLG
jgi:hypothetical protein